LKTRSTYLTGDNIYQFVEAQKGATELYPNKEAAREALEKLEHIHIEHYCQLIKVI